MAFDTSINFKTNANEAAKSMGKLSDRMNGLNKVTRKSGGDFSAFQKKIRKVNDSFVNMNKDVNRTSLAMKGLGGATSILGKAFRGLSIYKLATEFANTMIASLDMIETTHLFEVSLGNLASKTDETIQSLSKLSGLDVGNLRNRIGTFNMLGLTMGFTAENAQKMSLGVNQLSLDMGSLFNVSYQQISEDLRSGLIGQSRTLYKYGLDVTEAAIANEALSQGIDKSVRHMTQGEKMMLRYSVILKQATQFHGDFSATINTPINQLRILKERFATLARTIGDVFLPIAGKVILYANAMVLALTRVIKSFGLLFGIKSSGEISNLQDTFAPIDDDITAAMGGLNDGLSGATKKAKELKRQLGGFDELNIIQTKPQEASGGGSGGGGGIGGGSPLDLSLGDYDGLSGLLNEANELADKIQPKLEALLKVVGAIGIAFGTWKLFGWLKTVMAGKGVIGGILKFLQSFSGLGIVESIKLFFGTLTDTEILVGGIVGTIIVLVARFVDLVKNSETFRKGLSKIWEVTKKIGEVLKKAFDIIKTLAFFEWTTFKSKFESKFEIPEPLVKFGELLKKIGLDWKDLALTIGGIALLFANPALGAAVLVFEAISIAIRGIGYASSDALDEVDLFADISEKTKEKLEPLLDVFNDLSVNIDMLDFGKIAISQAIVDDISEKLKMISTMIIDELDADKNESLANLDPLKYLMADEKFKDLLDKTEKYYDDQIAFVEDSEQEILDILERAKEEGRTLREDEIEKINELEAGLKEVGIKHMTEMESEYIVIMERLNDETGRLSAEHAITMVNKAREARDGTIEAAEEQYDKIVLDARRLKDAGAISDEEYKEMVKLATKNKDKQIKIANEQYNGIYKEVEEGLGEVGKYVDLEQGEMLSKWQVGWREFKTEFSEVWDEIKINTPLAWEQLKKDAGEIWEGITTSISEKVDKIQKKFEDVWEGITKTWDKAIGWFEDVWKGIKKAFSKVDTYFKEKFEDAWNGIKEKWKDVKKWFGDTWTGIKEKFKTADTWFKDKFDDAWKKIKESWANVKEWFGDTWTGIKEKFANTHTWFKEKFGDAWSEVKKAFSISNAKEFFGDVWKGIKEKFGKVSDWFKETFSEAWEKVKKVFSKDGKVFDGIKEGILRGLKGVVNALIKGINKVIAVPFNGLNTTLSKIKKISILGLTPFSFIHTFSVPSIPLLAEGGTLNMGQMFIAREAGAELVGNFGNKTAVMNNDDIVKSVSDGVYNAVLSAMGNSGNKDTENIHLVVNVMGDTLVDRVVSGMNRQSLIDGRTVINV